MVKKLIIEKDDEQKMLDWDEERIKGFREKYNILNADEGTHILAMDIAAKDSPDQSVMCHFKLVDGKYEFDGVVEV